MRRDPVEYLLTLQRIISLILGITFLGICSVVAFLPAGDLNSFFGLLFLIFLFVSCFFSLTSYWWVSTITKDMLTLNQADNVLFRSLVQGSLITLIIVLAHLKELNFAWVLSILIGYIFYHLYLSKE